MSRRQSAPKPTSTPSRLDYVLRVGHHNSARWRPLPLPLRSGNEVGMEFTEPDNDEDGATPYEPSASERRRFRPDPTLGSEWDGAPDDVKTEFLNRLIDEVKTSSEYSETPAYYTTSEHSKSAIAAVNYICRLNKAWSRLCNDPSTWRAAYAFAWERVQKMLAEADKTPTQDLAYLVGIARRWRGMSPELAASVRDPEELKANDAWPAKGPLQQLTLQMLAMVDWGPLHLVKPREVLEVGYLGDKDEDDNVFRTAIQEGNAVLYSKLLRDPRMIEFISAPFSTARGGGLVHYLALYDTPTPGATHRAGNCTVVTLAYLDEIGVARDAGILQTDQSDNTALHFAAVNVNSEAMRFLAPAFFAAVDAELGIDLITNPDQLWDDRSAYLYNDRDESAAEIVANSILPGYAIMPFPGVREDEQRVRKFAAHMRWLFRSPFEDGDSFEGVLFKAAVHGHAIVTRVALEINDNRLLGDELFQALENGHDDVILEYHTSGALALAAEEAADGLPRWTEPTDPLGYAVRSLTNVDTLRIMAEHFGRYDWLSKESYNEEVSALRYMAEYRNSEALHMLLDNGTYVQALIRHAGDVEGPRIVEEMEKQLREWDEPAQVLAYDAISGLNDEELAGLRRHYEEALVRVRTLFRRAEEDEDED